MPRCSGCNVDRIAEVIAEHDVADHPARADRRDGEQDERHRYNERGFVRGATVPMLVMRVIAMRMRVEALLAVECEEHQPERIKPAGQHRAERGQIGERGARHARGIGRVHRFDDGVFREETRERRQTGIGKRADQHRQIGYRHVFAQPAHLAHVLLVVHRDDHRARAEEQHRLEKRMRHQMENRRRIGRCAERHRHIAQLRQRRIGDHALDVVLRHRDQRHEEAGDRADHEHERQRGLRQFEQRRHARDHENAGRHHGRGMDQRRDRGRAFHRIGQPHVQRELRALAHRADEQQYADHRQQRPCMAREDFDRIGRERAGGARRRSHNRGCRSTSSTSAMPSRKPKSPTRLTRNAFRLA